MQTKTRWSSFVVILIILVILGGCSADKEQAVEPGNKALNELAIFNYWSETDDSLKVANLKGDVLFTSPTHQSDSGTNIVYSLDDTKCAVLIGCDYRDDRGGELYCVTGSNSVKVSDNVIDMQISDDGTMLAYISENNGIRNLYIYDIGKNESTTIVENAKELYCLSPDGKSIAFSALNRSANDNTVERYLSVNGGEPEITDFIPIAISNNADYIYFLKMEKSQSQHEADLFVKHLDTVTTLSDNFESNLYLNADYSEAMFWVEKRSYDKEIPSLKKCEYILNICVNGEVISEVANVGASSVNVNAALFLDGSYTSVEQHCPASVTYNETVYRIKTFANSINDIGGLMYINSDYKAEKIVEDITSDYKNYQISADGQSLLYKTDDNRLFMIQDLKKSTASKEIPCDIKVTDFSASSDLSTIYIRSDNNHLFVLKNGKAEEIEDNYVTSYKANNSGSITYYIVANEVYYSKNGEKGVKIESINGFGSFYNYCGSVFYITNNQDQKGNNLYLLNGTKPTFLFQDVGTIENLNLYK